MAGDCGTAVAAGGCHGHCSRPRDGGDSGLDDALGRRRNDLAKGNRQGISNDELGNDIHSNAFDCVDESGHQ